MGARTRRHNALSVHGFDRIVLFDGLVSLELDQTPAAMRQSFAMDASGGFIQTGLADRHPTNILDGSFDPAHCLADENVLTPYVHGEYDRPSEERLWLDICQRFARRHSHEGVSYHGALSTDRT